MTGQFIFLVGTSGSGKTTVGRLLADRLGVAYVDTDDEVEGRAGRTVAEIFASAGERAFRDLEREVIGNIGQAALAPTLSHQRERGHASSPLGAVVATGGGALIDPANLGAMRAGGVVVWLDAPVKVLGDRLAASATADRPLLAGDAMAALERLDRERRPIYAKADLRFDTKGRSPAELVDDMVSVLGPVAERAPLWVRTPSQSYPVYVGAGLIHQAALLLRAHGLTNHLRIIADRRVASLHGEALREGLSGVEQTWYEVAGGEENKTLKQADRLYDRLLADRPERGDIVVAFGGGVVGDLAGFVAATLLRGVRLVQTPSTLLAQVDSSVGGKVGVDHPGGKNMIGAFHQPSLVLADVDLLRTLPPREVANGWAEVAKIAVVQDADLFAQMENAVEALRGLDPLATAAAVRRAVELKAALVERDERDVTGVRAILNYGHTLGHALEAATGYTRLRHGEAVAIGMAGAAHIASAMGLYSMAEVARQRALLERLGLPQVCGDVEASALRTALGLDKKRAGGRVRWVLPRGLGAAETGVEAPDRLVDEAIHLVLGKGA